MDLLVAIFQAQSLSLHADSLVKLPFCIFNLDVMAPIVNSVCWIPCRYQNTRLADTRYAAVERFGPKGWESTSRTWYPATLEHSERAGSKSWTCMETLAILCAPNLLTSVPKRISWHSRPLGSAPSWRPPSQTASRRHFRKSTAGGKLCSLSARKKLPSSTFALPKSVKWNR